jgi:hypothetical protein
MVTLVQCIFHMPPTSRDNLCHPQPEDATSRVEKQSTYTHLIDLIFI